MNTQKILQIISNILPESFKIDLKKNLGICNPTVALYRLKQFGINPELVVDAGAYHGLWTKTHSALFSDATWLLIEPQQQFNFIINKNLNSSSIKFIITNDLLYQEDGVELDFYMVKSTDIKTGSSIYKENRPKGDLDLESIKVKSKTLDTLCEEHELLHKKTFLKLDLQGAELDCLKGSTRLLESTIAILLETNILNYNIGSPVYRDVDNYLHSLGFRLFDIAQIHRLRDGRLNQLDLIYLLSTSKAFNI
jgi:FkbM family methyltransferase